MFSFSGSSKNPGIIPQTLHALFSGALIDERMIYKPCMAKDVLRLEDTRSNEQCRNDILRTFEVSRSSSRIHSVYAVALYVTSYFFLFQVRYQCRETDLLRPRRQLLHAGVTKKLGQGELPH